MDRCCNERRVNKGFTLIELLIVVAIIGILAAVGATVIPGILEKAKITAAKQNFKIVEKLIKIENMKCKIDVNETWMSYAPCTSTQNITFFFITLNNWYNATLMSSKAFPGMKNPYGRIHPFTKTDHPVGCCGNWTETGEINIQTMRWNGVRGLFIQSATAYYREGTKTKLVCHQNINFNETDPNCLRAWIPLE